MNKVINLFKAKNKRLLICVGIISVILATCQVVGHSIDTYLNLNGILGSISLWGLAMIRIIIYSIAIYFAVILVVNLIEKIKPKENKEYRYLTDNKESFMLAWTIILVMWFPYFIQYYPGLLSPDPVKQLLQITGEMNYTTNNPLLHTLIIKFFYNIGEICGSQELGIALYSITQMLVMSAIFAFIVYYMSKKKIPNTIRILTLISFAIYPVHAIYSVTMWKDVLFGGVIALYTIWIYEFTQNKLFIEKKKNVILFIILTIMIIMLTKNGIFVVLFLSPFLIIQRKDSIKKVLLMILSSVVLYFVIHASLVNIYNAESGEIKEALSIPMQQLARIVTVHENELNEQELAQIKKFIQTNRIAELYDPTISDPIKANFSNEAFMGNKLEFLSMWMKFLIKYPLDYIESFLCGNYGYWYPDAQNWAVTRSSDLGFKPILDTKIVPYIDSLIDRRDIPIITNLFSIGTNVWIMLIAFALCIYKKEYKLLIIFIPVITIVLTSMASPVFCEFRYVYGLFTTIPLLLAITYQKIKNCQRGRG